MTDILSSLNTNGSGLNITELSSSLANAEISPRRNIVEERIDGIEVSISAMAEARLVLEDLENSLSVITDDSLIQTNSSSSAISATVTDASKIEAGSTNLSVIATAKEQVLQFEGFSGEDAVVQGGTLNISFGVWTADAPPVFYAGDRPDVTMNVADGTTLKELAEQFDYVVGITASIIDVGDGTFTLGILSDTGGASGLNFSATATGAAADIALTDFDTTATIETHQVRAASDAVLEYNGITVYRSSNEIDDLIDGVTLNLNDVTSGTATITTAIEYDEALARTQVLVAKINETLEFLTEQTSRGILEGTDAGDLAGESTIEAVKSSIRSMMRSGIDGFGDETLYLSDFGISVNLQGTLTLDEDTFKTVMNETPEKVMALFESQVVASDPSVSIAGLPPSGTSTLTQTFHRASDTDPAYLGTSQLTSLFPGAGLTFYIASSGDMSGISLTVPDGVTDFDVTYGRSFADTMLDRIKDALLGDSAIASRETALKNSLTENEEQLDELDVKYTTIEERYVTQFTAMETIITQLNNTGSYIESLLDAWAAEAG
ncbi:Flagellar cap protein [Thalassovita gelatinovora]|uniref:Flagellar hook-associated protein 2 n=1 Tax=Thalassovita gelatinovora TaxID=53501 RepID=A0A0P1FKJ1_THAGE|nr:flagellar filament capping protein FliD [Thalassovita gelatinovora]QIZ79002.1 flagellar filament capping protein FliD [Thalassovita gelatinovora]CUH68549.1 Flagellar cap protein [Thalassovita gelatinovora]SEQ54469.1 flagellar hook-associated protein 2 [Thalassovita gelatinovora]